MSVSIHSPQNIYYTIVPSIYVQLGAAIDVLYDRVMFVWMIWYTDDSVTTICDDVMFYQYYMSGAMKYTLSGGNDTNGNTTDSSSSLSTTVAATVASR